LRTHNPPRGVARPRRLGHVHSRAFPRALDLSSETVTRVCGTSDVRCATLSCWPTRPQPWHVPRGAGASDLPIDEYLNQIEELVVRSDERTQAEGQQPEPGHEVSQEQHRRQTHPGATRHRYRVVGLRGWIRLLAPLQRRSCGMDVCISLGTLRGPPDCVEFACHALPGPG
jgi:hypothetical protein